MKVFLSSYLNNNLGDDLMIKMICDRYPHHDFYISNINNLSRPSIHCDNLYVIGSITPRKSQYILRAINKCLSYLRIPKIQIVFHFLFHKYDINLELGGSIFMQVTEKSWINKVRDASFIVGRIPINIIDDCNFGPYTSSSFLKKHKELFSKYDQVIFRDGYSLSLFSELNNVNWFPDIVFSYPFRHIGGKNYYIVSVVGMDNVGIKNNLDLYISGLVSLVDRISTCSDVLLLSFCNGEGDALTCEKIYKSLYNKKNVSIFEHENVEETVRVIENSKGMICTRFHASVSALSMNKPLIPIIYSNKISSMLSDLNYEGYKWNILNGEKIDIVKALEALNSKPVIDYAFIKKSKEHLRTLDKYLAEDSYNE